ncbi:type I polyketide synthase [Streptomyces sp. JJ36]|uniref:type I polyketide synthase n=1 Tax=Streptomyces sp. JJ36 TaxID=2736645 RepID=UPI002351459B|nr:type I polyketide synthase [Streptomyces sp. JJ36]MCF6524678.1 SDR family NAD(P)-dependent oxidoreductase [Streptomyces sp. JJ36]
MSAPAEPPRRSPFPRTAETLADHFRAVFQEKPEQSAYTFLPGPGADPRALSNADLDRRARAVATALRAHAAPGDRALVVCPPGLDYLTAFLGCLYAGVAAVPVHPPDPVLLKRTLPRLVGVVADARPGVVLATRETAAVAGELARHSAAFAELPWTCVDALGAGDPAGAAADAAVSAGASPGAPDALDALADAWRRPELDGSALAFLQYTSGSTGRPKGVMLSHANLIHNLQCINDRLFGNEPDTRMVSWLPPYHDMGLIGGLLAPAYGAFPTVFLSPVDFLKQPLRWLRAVAEHRATVSGAPNFAYELCVTRTTEEERAALDLGGWRVAFSGAEPVRERTLRRFAEAFAPAGFRHEAFLPCYGLAEATLCVSAGHHAAPPVTRSLEPAALADDRAVDARRPEEGRSYAGCGHTVGGQDLAVVDPETRTRLPGGRVGEIWVKGPSVAAGYWERPEETAETFGARLADTGDGPYLRTGDLGFLDGEELFVTGRRKDVLIVAGQNHYPQDIEQTVEECDPALRPDSGVACSSEGADGTEHLVVLHEITGLPSEEDAQRVFAAVRAAVAAEHGLQVQEIGLLRRASIPKTSSGKLQRAGTLEAYRAGRLKVLAAWSAASGDAAGAAASGRGVRAPAVGESEGAEQPGARTPGTAGSAATGDTAATGADGGMAGTSASGEAGAGADGGSAGSAASAGTGTGPGAAPGDAERLRAELERWLTGTVADRLGVPAASVDPRQPLAGYGLQSVDMVGIAGALEQRLGRSLPATLTWEHPTIEALAAHLAGTGGPAGAVAGPSVPEARPGVTRGSSSSAASGTRQDVAVVGIGCRFPGGVTGPADFWRLLRDGRDAVTRVPADRWAAEDYVDEDPSVPGRTTTAWGGFVDGIDRFDARFFGISGHEAARMDPQQRLLAEVAWEALEDAGVPADRLAGSPTGVFVGIATSDHLQAHLRDLDRIDAYTGTGNAFSIAANRLSYLLDLRGPSMALDTACSSSLVAVHQACRSLARGDCTVALAGGVNAILSPALAINFSKAGAMAADGRCKAFDARADGYVRSEGAGMVVLKPLDRALADGDPVYAVIRGGSVNQDGRSNGIMAPNPQAQEAVLRAAYADAEVEPHRVQYVEAHGTGTLLGDPIEAKALSAVLAPGRPADAPCLIGSVKSNLGHLEAAAGIAGLIKAALMLRHGTVPPSLHFDRPNPHIPFDNLAVRVAGELRPWPGHDGPALAGVSSFGFGGTNAHLVLQEPPRPEPAPPAATGRAELLTLSARDPEALRELATRHADRLDRPGDPAELPALAAAGALRRVHHEHRLACTGTSRAELAAALRAFTAGEEHPGLAHGVRRTGRRPRPVFVFAGQGPRWWPVARDLLEDEPAFRETIERCAAVLSGLTDWCLRDQLTATGADSRLDDPAVGQPALCAVQIALAAVWRSWGVEPAAVVGHSVGEIAAAQVAGALDLADALRVALHRGRVIRSATGKGRMAVAGVPMEEAERLLAERTDGDVWVAAANSPGLTVLSGEAAALERLAERLDAEGVFSRVLESVGFASHCPLMDPLRDELTRRLAGLHTREGAIPQLSTVTGRFLEGGTDAHYWGENLRCPVLFDGAVATLVEAGHDVFVEISPHPMLGDAVTERMRLQEAGGAVVASLRREEPGRATLLGELGRLWAAGHPVDWTRLHGRTVPMAALPAYPWQRERFPLETPATAGPDAAARTRHRGHPVLQTPVRSATDPGTRLWCARVDLTGHPYLGDHRVAGAPVLPAALVLDAALAAARETLGAPRAVLEDVRLTGVTLVPEQAAEDTLQLVLTPDGAEDGGFRLFSRGGTAPDTAGAPDGHDWAEVAHGRYRTAPEETAAAPLADARARCPRPLEGPAHYAALSAAGLGYGPAFQGVEQAWRGDGEAVARLRRLPELTTDRGRYGVHPVLLDGCLQALAAALPGPADGAGDPVQTAGDGDEGGTDARTLRETWLPVGAARFTLTEDAGAPCWAHADLRDREQDADEIRGGRVLLYDADGRLAGEVAGLTLHRLDGDRDRDRTGEALLVPEWREAGPAGTTLPEDTAEQATGRWLLLLPEEPESPAAPASAQDPGTAGDPLPARVRAALDARGARSVTVVPGDGYRRLAAGRYQLDPARPEDFAALLAELGELDDTPWAGVLHAWNLGLALGDGDPGHGAGEEARRQAAGQDGPDPAAAEAAWDRAQDLGTVSLLHLVQALARHPWTASPPPLAVVTRGAQPVGGGAAAGPAPDPAQAAVWGLARVAAQEHAELRPLAVDLDPEPAPGEAESLLAEVLRPARGDQLALRGGTRHTPALTPWDAAGAAAAPWPRRRYEPERDGNHRLLAERPGILGSLTPTVRERPVPGPGEVQIEVAAAGLNFSDVLKAMDVCPGVPPGITPLGAECAGRVAAVGEGVDRFRPGDRVMAVAPSALAAYATTAQELVAPCPEGLTDEQAAALPIAFLTVVYGLERLARLGPGESVLVHSATGGVGLAALQVARRNGAEVYATAGTEEKRALLRSLGVRHVMDSRSLDFADQVAEATGGRGVDVVLNSLTGEALRRSLGLLAPGGRFVEIGKQDVYADSGLGLHALRGNRSFLAVDLEQTIAERHDLIALLFAEVGEGFARGDFSALPVTPFGGGEAQAAFTHMAQARHTGKIVLRTGEADTVAVRPDERRIRPEASYLITGGLGALGLETARHLADRGARHLVLLGRSAPSADAEKALAALRERGLRVTVHRADLGRAAEVAALLDLFGTELPPLAGVVHAAGVLDDGLLLSQDRDRFRAVAAAKAAGAWHLHRGTLARGTELDFFVLYSSAAALLGSSGQANYAAANAFLDGLARHRRARGLPAQSIDWGPWTQAGLAARPDRGGALEERGVLGIDPADGVAALDRLLDSPAAQAAVLPLDRARLAESAAAGLLPPLLAALAAPAGGTADGGPGTGDGTGAGFRETLLAEPPGRRRRAALVRHCTAAVARVLSLEEAQVDTAAPLGGMGFDSLMSLELRKRLESSLGVELPATFVWRFPTVEAMAPFLAERMGVPLDEEPGAAPGDGSAPGAGAGPPAAARGGSAAGPAGAGQGAAPAAGGPAGAGAGFRTGPAQAPHGPGAHASTAPGTAAGAPAPPATGDEAAGEAAALDGLSDGEVEALLLAKLTEFDEGRDDA